MRSRPARLTLSAFAWFALGAAAFYTVHTQQAIDHRRATQRVFEATARDAADALDDAQAAQQAYVGIGQHASDWYPKVTTFLQTASSSIDTLRSTAVSQASGPLLLEASTSLTQVGTFDRAVRAQLDAGETGAAADAVYGEAADAISTSISDLDAAVAAERQAADVFETTQRQLLLYATLGAAAFSALALLLLALARPAVPAADGDTEESTEATNSESLSLSGLSHHVTQAPAAMAAGVTASAPTPATLKTMATVCTEFGRVRDAAQLKPLLEQAAGAIDARGIIVWLGSTAGADLRPVLAHGYSEKTLARIPTLARSADNAAAAAYRTGELQVIKGRQGGPQGTVVAPLVVADGCIGAVTAEIRDGGEGSDTTLALTTILAAQLSGLLASAADESSAAPEAQTAAG